MARDRSIGDPAVKAVFDSYPDAVRRDLLRLRELIFTTAADTAGVGPLVETLKWSQPAYLPKKSGVGTTIRIDQQKGAVAGYAMFFHCQTTLVSTFRELYPAAFTFQGNRAIVFSHGKPLPRAPLQHCIALALTYHVRRRQSRVA